MISRRLVLSSIPAGLAARIAAPNANAASDGFASFVAAVRAEARRQGVSAAVLDRAFAGVRANQAILDKLHHPPEFTMTWAQYRELLLTDKRIEEGRAAYRLHRALLDAVRERFGVSPGVILGIWGVESSYGAKMGDYRVVEALATCAWGSSRRAFFQSELLDALQILQRRTVSPARMTGSYAGAMGQPQFMPSSYLHYAVDFTGNGRRDIWTSVPDVLGSIANYLARNGWRSGEGWGMQVSVPPGLGEHVFGREDRQSLNGWARLGVRSTDGRALTGEREAVLIQPDGAGGDAFLVFGNFRAIKRYNSSDFYALLVGLLGDDILA